MKKISINAEKLADIIERELSEMENYTIIASSVTAIADIDGFQVQITITSDPDEALDIGDNLCLSESNSDIKWQSTFHKRAAHAFFNSQSVGGMSLCGRESLNTGETYVDPKGQACGSCLKKIEKLNGSR